MSRTLDPITHLPANGRPAPSRGARRWSSRLMAGALALTCAIAGHAQTAVRDGQGGALGMGTQAPVTPVTAQTAAQPLTLNLSELAGRPLILIDIAPLKSRGVTQVDRVDLRGTLQRALSGSDELAAVNSRSRAQRHLVDVARGALLPRLDARINGGRELSRPGTAVDPETKTPYMSSDHGRGDTNAVLRQSLIDLGAMRELRRQRSLADATDADVWNSRDQVAQDASIAHLDLLQYSLGLDFAREYQVELEKLFNFVNNRSQAGGVSPAEAERVRARAINARSSVIEALGTLESALITYRRLVGAVPLTMPADDLLAPQGLPDVLTAIEQARERSPALRQLRETSRAIEAEADAVRAKFLPKLEFEWGNYRTRGAGGTPGTSNDTRAMLVLSMNLLNGGADAAQIQAVLARLDETRFRLADAERKLEESLMVTFNTIDAVSRRTNSVREEYEANQKVVVAFGDQLVSGSRQLLDVLDAQQRLFQSRGELLRLTMLEATLKVQAMRLIGGLSEPIQAANGPARPPAPAPAPVPAAPAQASPTEVPPLSLAPVERLHTASARPFSGPWQADAAAAPAAPMRVALSSASERRVAVSDRPAEARMSIDPPTMVGPQGRDWATGGLAAGSQAALYVRLMVQDQDLSAGRAGPARTGMA